MSDSYSLREIGGLELSQHYPDRGLIPDSEWYNAVLHLETEADGFLGRLRSFAISTHPFGAVLSANADGLRIVVSLEQLVIFIPWSEATVSAERSLPATRVSLRTKAAPALTLVFHLDDQAADELLVGIVPALPQRDPPRRLGHVKPWELGALVIVLLVLAGFLVALR